MPLNRPLWIFDMDGTLTEAVHDFQQIRQSLGLSPDAPILDSIQKAQPDEAKRLKKKLDSIEWDLAALARPAAGIHEFLINLLQKGCSLGILTRNRHDVALETLRRAGLQEFFAAEHIVDREKALPKPHPEGIEILLNLFHRRPEETAMVGDFKYDLEAGRAAGTSTVYIDPTGEFPFRHLADICARDFLELGRELKINFKETSG